ncbi:MAG: 1-acyl-sn-glycerol-3-phosphate acyltransferase [Chitinophagaceae bacterium]|nr:1-acyl-sn-glycerol-3-phosphate acyltransferase [Chitinophagaceae bacterium]
MKLFKEIFGRIWALWAAIAFIGTMLIYLIPFLLFIYFKKDPDKTHRFTYWSQYWIKVFLFLVASPLKIKGRENFAPGENYIVLCNHNSFMDVPITTPAIPGGNKTIAKVELSKIPLFGLLYKTGSILVDRKSDISRKESFSKMKDVLKMGLHMCLYPEGTRNKTKEPLRPFHSGAFRLAVDTGKSIVPALIFNTRKVLPADKTFYAMPHRVEIHFLPPMEVMEDESAEALRERVFGVMKEYYQRNSK